MDYLYFLFVVLAFLSASLMIEGAYLTWSYYRGSERKKIERRLNVMVHSANHWDEAPHLLKEHRLAKSAALNNLLQKIPVSARLDKLLSQTGLPWNVAQLLGLMLLSGIAGFGIGMLINLTLFVAVLAGLVATGLPILYLLNVKRKRIHTIEEQLPDALDLIGRAMQAGHAFPSAMKMVRDEMPEPASTEFGIAFNEINYGISVPDALTNMSSRIPSTDVRYFVISVLIQRQTGGNLVELLGNISRLIRERLKLLGTVRVLATEGRLSAWILTILPFAVALIINILNPEFLRVLWSDPAGSKLSALIVATMGVGIYWMWRIIKIHI